jgi:hypothetical protein
VEKNAQSLSFWLRLASDDFKAVSFEDIQLVPIAQSPPLQSIAHSSGGSFRLLTLLSLGNTGGVNSIKVQWLWHMLYFSHFRDF